MAFGDRAEDAPKVSDAFRVALRHPTAPSIESRHVAIEHFVWTAHARLRLNQRRLSRSEVEQAIRETHAERQPNDGRADWLIACTTPLGVHFEAVYDHPVAGDDATARIVSAWRIG
jgi:hypothetical protein